MNYYEMRRRTMNLVQEHLSLGKENEEICYAAFIKYGASRKMVEEMITTIEGKMQAEVRRKLAKRNNEHKSGKLDKRTPKK